MQRHNEDRLFIKLGGADGGMPLVVTTIFRELRTFCDIRSDGNKVDELCELLWSHARSAMVFSVMAASGDSSSD